jgi:hypothetical protein
LSPSIPLHRLAAPAANQAHLVLPMVYSVGWDLRERERHAIDLVPEQAWQIAIDHRGQVRERRAETACDNIGCAHRKCWVEQAHVTELTPAAARRPGRRPARQLARQRPSCVAN